MNSARILSIVAAICLAGELRPEPGIVDLGPFAVIGNADAVFELAGSGYVAEGEWIRAFQTDDIQRLLNRVPGVYFREEDGLGLLPNISLRGVDTSRNSKLTVMEDGIPTAPAPYSAPAAYYSPTTGRMSGVEVLKGSSQIRFGPHTTGGVINYLSTPLPASRSGLLEAAAGNHGERRLFGWYGDAAPTPVGELQYLLELHHRNHDGFKNIDAAGTWPGSAATGMERTDYMLKLRQNIGARNGQYLEWKIGYTDLVAAQTYIGLSDADFAADPYRLYAAARADELRTHHARTYLRYVNPLSSDWKLALTGYYNKFHRNWYKLHDIRDLDLDGNGRTELDDGRPRAALGIAEALAGAQDGKGLAALRGERAADFRVRANNRDYALHGLDLKLRGAFATGSLAHEIDTGLRYHFDRARRNQWHDLYRQAADGSWSAPGTSAMGSDGNRAETADTVALYVEDAIRLGRWTLRPGARYEWLRLGYTDYATDGSQAPLAGGRDTLRVFTPGAGLQYAVREDWMAFANLYRGTSVPGPRAYVVDGVRAERSRHAEIGLRHRANGGPWYGELIGFWTRYRDLIVIDNIGGSGSGRTENVGAVRSYGIELLLGTDLWTSPADQTRVPAGISLTWTVAELVGDAVSRDAESLFAGGRDGNRVPYIPEFKVHGHIGWDSPRWRTTLTATWTDASFSTASASTTAVNPVTGTPDARFGRIPSVLLLDWQGTLVLGRGWESYLTVQNLFDKAYIGSRHPYGPRPGAPRMVIAGLRFRY
jgi:Fe(3+) dicitrate transport protein